MLHSKSRGARLIAIGAAAIVVLGVGAQRGAANETTKVRVAGVVLKWIRGDKKTNYERAAPLIRKAASEGAQIVCTTECFLDGYAIADNSIPLEVYRDLGEAIPNGEYYARLAKLADELDIHLIAGMLEADGDRRYNAAVLIGPDGKLIGKYRKHKLEHELVRNVPGDETPTFATPFGKIGLIICADRRDSEWVGQICAKGADALICPSGGMFGPVKNDPIVIARSKENKIPIVFVHPAEFLATGPDGAILKRSMLGEDLLIPKEDIGTAVDQNEIFTIDLEIPTAPKNTLKTKLQTGDK